MSACTTAPRVTGSVLFTLKTTLRGGNCTYDPGEDTRVREAGTHLEVAQRSQPGQGASLSLILTSMLCPADRCGRSVTVAPSSRPPVLTMTLSWSSACLRVVCGRSHNSRTERWKQTAWATKPKVFTVCPLGNVCRLCSRLRATRKSSREMAHLTSRGASESPAGEGKGLPEKHISRPAHAYTLASSKLEARPEI